MTAPNEGSFAAPARRTAFFSERELQVLGLIAEGMRDKEIATRLFISANTVKTHIKRIAAKTGLGGGRCRFACLYVDQILPYDFEGGYVRPGEKLAEWRAHAEEMRTTLLVRGLTPKYVMLITLLSDPKNANKTNAWAGAQLSKRFGETDEDKVKTMLGVVYSKFPPDRRRRVSLVVMQRLAPLNAGLSPR
jgi:DNA-binding CsgD family transcriptional regulator